MAPTGHTPVLLQETIQALAVQPGGRYIDCTLGGSGHAEAVLKSSFPGGQLLGIDADPEAIAAARKKLTAYRGYTLLVNDNFVNLQAICIKHDFVPVHGILFDLGLSSLQLDIDRGFSFRHDAPLDMRLSPNQEVTAADLVNTLTEAKFAQLVQSYGEEHLARQIAHRIVAKRPIRTTFELVQAIEQAVGSRRGRLHPATRTFQALRIATNHELENLKTALEQAVELLGFNGRLVVISYHSLEDRIVKQLMQRESRDCICPPETIECRCGHKARLRIINRKVIAPSAIEVERNPRSRSARLRAAERLITQEEYYQRAEQDRYCAEANGQGWRRPTLLKRLKVAFGGYV
jgi:16S rRNA (cytosine1402-N4)-methyltransferase